MPNIMQDLGTKIGSEFKTHRLRIEAVETDKQENLVSGTNIKTINGTSVLGSGDIVTTQTTISGNAGTATKLQNARTISLTGDVTGNVSFDGSANVSMTATVADDSHNHIISNIDGLQVALDNKVDKVSKQSLDSNSALRVSGTTVSLYKGDGTFDSITTQDTVYTLPTATSTVKGGIEIFSDTVQTVASNSVSTTAGRTYGVQLNSTGQAVVNVPWSDTNTVYTHPNSGVTAGTYSKVTVNAQGHVTTGASLSASDIPSLDASKITSGTIDTARLPSFVDDVLEFANLAGFPATGEAGKIYIALDTNKTYRWSGSTYVHITSGAVDSVAGKTGVVSLVKADVGLENVDNTSDANKNVLSATKLATARTINLFGGATGTDTLFDGTNNISIPVTGLNASNLNSGTIPDARLSGVYSDMSLKLDGNNTVFTTESSGSANISRTVYGLAEYKNNSASTTGAIVFIAPSSSNAVMHQLEVSGLLYKQNIVSLIVQGYINSGAWSDLRKISTGTVDIQVRWGVTPDGKNCLILGDVDTVWSYPHMAITRAMFSYGGVSDAYCIGWTVALVTSFTGYTNISANISDGIMTGNVSSATKLATARTVQTNLDSTASASFNGSANITPGVTGTLPVSNGGTGATTLTGLVKGNGTSAMSVAVAGTDYVVPSGSITGNASTATKLATAITINGVSFDGTANIVAPTNLTIGTITTTAVPIESSSGTNASIPAATTTLAGVMTAADKVKLDGIATGATANTGTVTSVATSGAITGGTITSSGTISHSTADGYLHVPATGTTNNGKVLMAGATAGSLSWTALPSAPVTSVAGKTGAVTLVKGDVGLGSVDNTADSTKNVLSATKLTTARTISLTGDVTGSVSFDGSANVSMTATVADDSHNHIISNIDGLQTELDSKLSASTNLLVNPNTSAVAPDTLNMTGIDYCNAVSLFGQTDGALYSNAHSSPWQHQIYGDYRSGNIAVRGKNNNVWTPWHTVWHSGNDGSGSGLDADLLGGLNSSAFVKTASSQALNSDALRITDNTLYLYKGDGTNESVAVAAKKGTATVYGGAKFSLSGTTLTITTT